jgi:hypothetical protein
VPDLGDLAVHRHRSADDPRAESLAERLVAETDAEKRDVAIGADQLDDATGARRSAGTGRDDDRRRTRAEELARLERIVADDADRAAAQPFDLLDEVVREGVVVIDDDDRP